MLLYQVCWEVLFTNIRENLCEIVTISSLYVWKNSSLKLSGPRVYFTFMFVEEDF